MANTSKQRKFVAEYIVSFNATQSAINAGYSEKTAYSIGHELLKKPEIALEIEGYLNNYAMKASEVLFHLTQIARGDIGEVIDSAGFPSVAEARDAGITRIIRKIKSRTINTDDSEIHETEIEMYDRLRALDLLAKYHDLTNKVVVEQWQDRAIDDIRNGLIKYDVLVEEFGDNELATELFKRAGVPVSVKESETEQQKPTMATVP